MRRAGTGLPVPHNCNAHRAGVIHRGVVEVSFRPATSDVWLLQWQGPERWRLDLEQCDYRVRYCAYGWDYAAADDDEDSNEQYLLQFWLAPPDEDQIIRQESRATEYWHSRPR